MAHLLFDDIVEGLRAADSPIQPPDVAALKSVLGGNRCSKTYAQMVVWLCDKIRSYDTSRDVVAMPQNPEEEPLFRVEMVSLLRSLDCPLPNITTAESLIDPNNRTAALHFLVSELLTVRLLSLQQPAEIKVNTETGCFSGHPSLEDVAIIYGLLALPNPGPEDSVPDIFESIKYQLDKLIRSRKTTKDAFFSDPLLRLDLSPQQWARLDDVAQNLNEDYTIRFKTLLRRLDLTMTSFKWGKESKDKAETIDKIYLEMRRRMPDSSSITIPDVLACRSDSLSMAKTSSGTVRDNTRSKLNKMVIVGKVPDRGGRPYETRPEPEIPSWAKDKKYSQQSQGGRTSARGGQRYQQQPRSERNYHQNQGYHNRLNQPSGGYSNTNNGYQAGGNSRGGYNNNRNNRGYQRGGYQQQRNSSWGGHRGNSYRRGGGVY